MSILNLFKAATRQVEGMVERIGPHFGHGEIYGYEILLSGSMTHVVVLRDGPGDYPIGLTMVGDEITFEVNERSVATYSSFKNKTLDARLGR